MKFSSFEQFRKSFPKIAALMEDPESGTFVQNMKAKVENGEDLTVKMRQALEKIASEKALASDIEVPDVNQRVALAIEIFQNKTETKRSGIANPVLEFKTNFGVRGRLQLANASDTEDDLLEAVREAGMEDEDDKGSLYVEVEAEIVWKKNTFIILGNVRNWDGWDRSDPRHSGSIRAIPSGGSRTTTFPSAGPATSVIFEPENDEEEPSEVGPSGPPISRTPPKRERPRRERPRTEIDRLQQRAEDSAENWEKALDFK